ncbi:MAG TPA: sigma-70 family RNA polymerase sigma factor [Planctomycetota bacterium]
MMLLRPVELAFARFQKTRDAKALAIVFDRTANELLRVARHVATDPAAADDLVQATFLTAIESAASHERGRPVLPWLLGILANHARAARRHARRQPDLQRLRGDVIADVHAEIEARDVRSELAAAIARLPDVYRPVLRLWFEHGLEAHEIAAVLERPAGTVRAQLSRGMDSLRRLLPASLAGGAALTVAAGNGLAAVRTQVLAHGVATRGLPSSLAIGGLLVLNHKVFAAGAAAALAFVLWFVSSPPAPPAIAGAGERTAAEVATAPARPPATAPAAADRVDAGAPAAPRDMAPPASPRTSLVVRVRDKDSGEPVPGIGVALEQPEQRVFGLAFVSTDREGTARFDEPTPGGYTIQLDRVGRSGTVAVAAGKANERTVEIPAGIVAEGTVLDEHGQPAAGASVVRHGAIHSAPTLAIADASGRFRIAHLPDGVELQARRAGNAPSLAHQVEGAPGTHIELSLRLHAGGRRITGRVLDAAGKPAAGAAIALLPAAAASIDPFARGVPQPRAAWQHTDRDGRFASDEVAPEKYVVVAIFAEWATTPAVAEADAREHDADVELRGAPPAVVEGSVRRNGKGLAGVDVRAFTERCAIPIGYLQNHLGHVMVRTGRDGSFRVPSLLPGEVVLHAFEGTAVLAEKRIRAVAGETARGDLDVARSNPLAIRVKAPAALPDGLRAWVHRRDTAPDATPSPVEIDARGNGRYDAPRPGPVDVDLAVLPGRGGYWLGLARIEMVGADREEVLFELSAEQLPSRHLRGRLVDALKAPQSGMTVRAQRTDGPPVLLVMAEAMTAADGTFTIGPLPAGRYLLTSGALTAPRRLCDALLTSARDEELGDVVLRER